MMPRNDDYRILNLEQQLADERAKNGQLEHALANLRESFDAIQGVSLSESIDRIKELEAKLSIQVKKGLDGKMMPLGDYLDSLTSSIQAQDRTIKALQSKVAKQKKALAGLQDVKFRLQKEEEQSRRYHGLFLKGAARIKELEANANEARRLKQEKFEALEEVSRMKVEAQADVARTSEAIQQGNMLAAKLLLAEQKIKEMEQDAAARAKVREMLVDSINKWAAKAHDLEGKLYQKTQELAYRKAEVKDLKERIRRLVTVNYNLEESLAKAWRKGQA